MNEDEMRKRLEMLRTEHRDLDAAIDALTGAVSAVRQAKTVPFRNSPELICGLLL